LYSIFLFLLIKQKRAVHFFVIRISYGKERLRKGTVPFSGFDFLSISYSRNLPCVKTTKRKGNNLKKEYNIFISECELEKGQKRGLSSFSIL